MSYSVIKLISNAYYASGIASREFEDPNGSQMNDGLGFLNDILADKAIEKDMIPYYTNYSFNATAGVEKYFIPNLEQIETLVFYLNGVRYQMRHLDMNTYHGASRPDNVTSLPFNWNLIRCPGGAYLYMYFKPDSNYPIEAWGLFRLASVALNQDLTSSVARANLGQPRAIGAGTINTAEFVINGVDIVGSFATPQLLATYINTGIVPNITANIIANEFILTNVSGGAVNVVTNGEATPTNCVTFYSFRTTEQPLDQTFMPMVLDHFYINYLKFSLTDRICTEYNVVVPPGVAKQLLQYQTWIASKSAPMDLTQNTISPFRGNSTLSYGTINLSMGWTVG